MFTEGRGVALNYAEAIKWYRLAAKQGDASAQFNLGSMYAMGLGVYQDYVTAFMWTNIAAANIPANRLQEVVDFNYSISKKMTARQIAESQALAKRCTSNKFQGCY
jgi:TPR repeat protein